MKSAVLLFAFVLLQAESDAKPIWITGVTPTVATSPRLSQRPPSAQRIADKIFKNQRLTEFGIAHSDPNRAKSKSPMGCLDIIMSSQLIFSS